MEVHNPFNSQNQLQGNHEHQLDQMAFTIEDTP